MAGEVGRAAHRIESERRRMCPEAPQGLGHGFLVFPEEPIPTPPEYFAIYDPEPPEANAEEDDGVKEKIDPWRKWR